MMRQERRAEAQSLMQMAGQMSQVVPLNMKAFMGRVLESFGISEPESFFAEEQGGAPPGANGNGIGPEAPTAAGRTGADDPAGTAERADQPGARRGARSLAVAGDARGHGDARGTWRRWLRPQEVLRQRASRISAVMNHPGWEELGRRGEARDREGRGSGC